MKLKYIICYWLFKKDVLLEFHLSYEINLWLKTLYLVGSDAWVPTRQTRCKERIIYLTSLARK